MNLIHPHSACSILHSVTNILKENSLCKELEWQAPQVASGSTAEEVLPLD